MPRDPELLAETRAWLLKAATDLRAAEAMHMLNPPLLEAAVFHCQQAVEKALKGFLTWHDVRFRRVHELDELGMQCARVDPSLTTLMERVDDLTKYATMFRYPGASSAPAVEEGADGLALAREAFSAVLSRVPDETHP